MIIVSWNLNHWQQSADNRSAAWEYIADELGADVALGARGPPATSDVASGRVGHGGSREWGTRVVSPAHPLAEVTSLKHVRVSESRIAPGRTEQRLPRLQPWKVVRSRSFRSTDSWIPATPTSR